MFLLYLIASIALAQSRSVHDEYIYVDGQCLVLLDNNPNIFWGLHKEQCLNVASVDRRLNAAYKANMAILDSGGKSALRRSQRSWLRSIGKVCVIIGGTIRSADSMDCFIEAAERRIAFLQK